MGLTQEPTWAAEEEVEEDEPTESPPNKLSAENQKRLDERLALITARANELGLSTRMIPGLLRWVSVGLMPGDFLMAVLRHDLREAMLRADSENRVKLWAWAKLLHNSVPVRAQRGDISYWKGIGGLAGIFLKSQGVEG